MPARAEARRPAIIHWNGLGDRLTALPAVRALAELFKGRLTVCGLAGDQRNFYAGLPLRRVVEVETWGAPGGRAFDLGRLLAELDGCDLLVSFNHWHNEASQQLLDALGPIDHLGYFPSFSRPFRRTYDQHVIDDHFELVQLLAPELCLDPYAAPPDLPAEAVEKARQIRALAPPGTKLLAVHTETAAEKRWPAANMARLLDAFLERRPDYLVFVVDRGNTDLAGMSHAERVFSTAGAGLPVAMALVGSADVFVGIDSVMLHAADFFRVPSVGLFGPTCWRRWGFRFARHQVAAVDGPMAGLEVEKALAALELMAP